jgi:hypothetical protein
MDLKTIFFAWFCVVFSFFYIQRRERRGEWKEIRREIWPFFYYIFFIVVFSWWYWPLMMYYIVSENITEKKAVEAAEIEKLRRQK